MTVKGPSRIHPKRGQKTPKGYTVKYEYPDSDYVTHRRKVFVKKKTKKK